MSTKLTSNHSEKVAAPVQSSALMSAPTKCETIPQGNFINLPIQWKLSIGTVDDPLETEADAIADKVMRMPESSFIQRKCANCEKEEKLQRKPLASFIQRKEVANNNYIASDAVAGNIQSSKGGGSAMPSSTKSFMESRFGANFSNVSIHTDNNAAQLSNQLNAQAFTVGNDIYFNEGKYQPESFAGKHLLAHELTHTIQQAHHVEGVQRNPFTRMDRIHGPIEENFCKETGDCTPGSHTSKAYEDWLAKENEAMNEFDNFKLKAEHLKLPAVINKFAQMSLEELNEYRSNYMIASGKDPNEFPHDPAIIKYLTDLMMSRPTQNCTKAEADKAEKVARDALKNAPAMVKEAQKAIDLILNIWMNNKSSLLSGSAILGGEVACAFRSNFNIKETNSNWGVTAINVERKLIWLQKRLTMPVSFVCEPINSKVCLEATGKDAEAYVVNHTGPIHLCYGFRESTFSAEPTIIHEMLHFRPGLSDDGGYAKFSTMAMTCIPGIQFTAAPDILANTADSITGFIMHISNTSANDLKVLKAAFP